MRVTIVGPNLPREAKATMYVHRAGCRDLKRGWLGRAVAHDVRFGGGTWDVDVESRLQVESYVYDFAPDENEDYALGDYQDEFYFAPCLDELPLSKES